MTARLIIVRHGNTFAPGETPRRIGAGTDLALADSGRKQASQLAAWFADQGYRFDRALSSPLRRTRETAETILSAQDVPPEIALSDFLAEIDHGVDEDQPEEAVVARLGPKALRDWDERGIVPEGWTANRDGRLAEWTGLLAKDAASTTLLVTSNGAARFALLADPRLAMQAAALPSLKLRTAAFGIIDVDAAGPRLVAWDQRPPMRSGLPWIDPSSKAPA